MGVLTTHNQIRINVGRTQSCHNSLLNAFEIPMILREILRKIFDTDTDLGAAARKARANTPSKILSPNLLLLLRLWGKSY